MKRLDELGVSPTPWKVYDKYYVRRSDTGFVANCSTPADARLIAATPSLYECLREAMEEKCDDCHWGEGKECGTDDDICTIKHWRKALGKAGGAE